MEAARHPWPTLGVLLIRDGIVSKDVLESILAEQRDSRERRITGRRLGEILVERDIVTPTQVAKLLAEQYELPYTDLDVTDLDPRLAARLDEDAARRFSALPVGARPDGSILLAIADPGTVVFSDELRRLLDANLHFTVVGPEALEAAIAFVHDRIPDPLPSALEASDEPTATTEPSFPGLQPAVAHLWPPLGALLVREGLLSDADLETALAQQRLSTSQRLGEILVDRGIVPPAVISRLVAEQYELEFVELHDLEIDPVIGRLLPEHLASEYSSLPIAQHDDGSLDVAIADPTNVVYADELHRALGVRLTFVVASAEDIAAALERVNECAEAVETPEMDTAVETDLAVPADEVDGELDVSPMPATTSLFELPDRDVEAIPDEGPTQTTHAELALVSYSEASASASEVEVPDVDLRNEPSPETPAQDTAVSFDDSPHAAPYAAPFDVLSDVDDPATQELVVPTAALPRPVPPDELETAEVEAADGEHADDSREPPETAATAPTDADVGLDALLLAAVGAPAEAVDVAPIEKKMDDGDAEPAQRATSELEVTLERLLALGASALHFSPLDDGYRARVRLDGIMREAGYVASTELAVLLERLGATTPFRTHVTHTTRGEKLTLFRREHAPALTTLSELGFSDRDAGAVHDRLMSEAGVLVVCGPAGSGTTTTQYAALAELDTGDRIAATVEGSVHRVLDGVDQLEVDEASGMTFAQGICALLESDTDIVLVGEIADDETAGLAFEAALSGRHVLAVLRAPSATAAIARLAELGVAPGLLSQTLACVVAQRLVRRVCDDCRETYYASESELEALGSTQHTGPRLLARGRGCQACEETGYRGRAGVFEVLPITDEIRQLIGSEAPKKKLRRAASTGGMRTLREDAIRLCLEGVTTTAEVDRVLGIA